MEDNQNATVCHWFDSFKNVDHKIWPDILENNNVYEIILHFRINTITTDTNINVIKNENGWYNYVNGQIDLNNPNPICRATNILDKYYTLLIESEFNKYRDNTIIVYMKINLLLDSDIILPDIANHMKRLL